MKRKGRKEKSSMNGNDLMNKDWCIEMSEFGINKKDDLSLDLKSI